MIVGNFPILFFFLMILPGIELLPDAKRRCEHGLGVGVVALANVAVAAGLKP